MRKVLSILLCLVLLVCSTSNSFATSTVTPRKANGHYWENTPRTVYFKCNFSTAQWAAVNAAIQQWNSVKTPQGNDIVTMVLTTSTADNSVRFGSLPYDVCGRTEFFRDPYSDDVNAIGSVQITLNDEPQYVSWSIGASPGCYDLQSVVLHELGHALGVAHCHEKDEVCYLTTCELNVMNRSLGTNTVRTTFQPYDTASYIVLYY